jgi:hypothetical protein
MNIDFKYVYYWILWHILRCAYLMGLYKPAIRQKSFLDENFEYIEPLKTRFLETFNNSQIDFNENINKLFYDKVKFTNYMSESNTELEKLWKTKIMMENTPRGNIIMFYDAYKMGFSFYCDQKVISYDILNAAAMKYVIMFRCQHFFLDELFVPVEKKSPLIDIHFSPDTKPNAVIKKQNDNKVISRWINQLTPKETDDTKEPEKMKNKFIYLGKIANYSFIQSIPKPRKVLAKFISPQLESLGGQKLNYKDYKNWVKQQSSS